MSNWPPMAPSPPQMPPGTATTRSGATRWMVRAVRGGGRCVFASHPQSGERISLDPHDLISGKQIAGSWGGGSDPDRDIPRFAALYRSGKLPLEKLLPRRYALDEINGALDDLEQRRAGRPLIVIDPSIG